MSCEKKKCLHYNDGIKKKFNHVMQEEKANTV